MPRRRRTSSAPYGISEATRRAIVVAAAFALLHVTGCAVKPVRDQEDVAEALRLRTGHGSRFTKEADEIPLPEGTELHDGLSQDEAVAIALWNNPAYRADLAELGLAQADLVEAGLLKNPVLAFLFPWGPKQWEATLRWPLESIWQRPRRVEFGQLNVERVAERLVKNGLDLAAEAKVAFVDLSLAEEQAKLLDELADVEREIESVMSARFRAGDVSKMEVDRVRASALEARQLARRAIHEAEGSRLRLLGLFGLADTGLEFDPVPLDLATPPEAMGELPSITDLLADAFAGRPDLRAAELAIEIAGEKRGLAKSQFMSISALLDANERGLEGSEVGPGITLTIPIFDQGQSEKARATAELEMAAHRYSDTRNRVAVEVREAYARLSETREAARDWHAEIVRLRSDRVHNARRARAAGEVSDLVPLQAQRDYIDALLRQIRISAELLRAQVRLENALGSSLERQPTKVVGAP